MQTPKEKVGSKFVRACRRERRLCRGGKGDAHSPKVRGGKEAVGQGQRRLSAAIRQTHRKAARLQHRKGWKKKGTGLVTRGWGKKKGGRALLKLRRETKAGRENHPFHAGADDAVEEKQKEGTGKRAMKLGGEKKKRHGAERFGTCRRGRGLLVEQRPPSQPTFD